MVQLIKFYRRWLSPLMPPRCRFYPTCSEYALDAIHSHGTVKGSLLATKRLCRCHPLSAGGYDPVPETINHACGESPSANATGNQKS